MLIYWNAWRGGPAIGLFEGPTQAQAEAAETLGAAKLAEAYAAARCADASVPTNTLKGIAVAYKASPEFTGLGAETRSKWLPWLDKIMDGDLGSLPTVALKAKGARRIIKRWRNTWSATPRTADYAIQVLRRMLSWALEEELVDANPAMGIKALYDADRSDDIVEPDEFAAVLKHTTRAAALFFRMARASGLRRGDLRKVLDTDADANSISLLTNKSGETKRVIFPLVDDAHWVLAELRRLKAEIVADRVKRGKPVPAMPWLLVTARGKQWSKDGPTGAWIKAAKAAGVDKHLHDLRGLHATLLMAKKFTDEQIAEVMGWSDVADVRKIRRRYVDRNRIADAMIEQLRG